MPIQIPDNAYCIVHHFDKPLAKDPATGGWPLREFRVEYVTTVKRYRQVMRVLSEWNSAGTGKDNAVVYHLRPCPEAIRAFRSFTIEDGEVKKRR